MAQRLTEKAERFCIEYPIDYSAEKAALRAKYKPGGPPNDPNAGARGNGHRLLKDRRVIERVSQIQQDILPEMGRKYLLSVLWKVIHDPSTPPQVVVQAVEKAAKVQHLYETEEMAPGKVTVNINTDVPSQLDDEGSSDRHPTIEVVIPPEEGE